MVSLTAAPLLKIIITKITPGGVCLSSYILRFIIYCIHLYKSINNQLSAEVGITVTLSIFDSTDIPTLCFYEICEHKYIGT